LFAHNWLTIPYYLDRAFTGTAVSNYYEFFSNLNPLIIFVLSPIVAAMTASKDMYRMMIVGTLVMAAPTFLLAFGPNLYLFLAFIVLMSVGEAIWSPRFLQWISEIAPPGKVGMYQGIGQLPWFMTKMLTSFYSGYFVAHYCPKPESGLPMNTGAMWLIYSGIAMITPIGLILAKRWMQKGKLAGMSGAPAVPAGLQPAAVGEGGQQ
jgi:MFS family permease